MERGCWVFATYNFIVLLLPAADSQIIIIIVIIDSIGDVPFDSFDVVFCLASNIEYPPSFCPCISRLGSFVRHPL